MITLQGHTGNVDSMVYSPDCQSLLSGSDNGQVKLWDLTTHRERISFDTEGRRVSAVDISPDGTKVLAMLRTFLRGSLVIWDAITGRRLQKFEMPCSANNCLFSRDGRMVIGAAGSTYGVRGKKAIWPIFRWNLATGARRRVMSGHTNQIGYLAASPDGRLLASGSMDHTVRVWDIEAGKELASFKHRTWIYGLAFSPDSRMLASSAGREIGLWDLTRWKKKATLRGHTKKVRSLAFLPDGRTLFSAAEDGLVRMWDTDSGQQTSAYDWKIKQVITVVVAPDGMTAAAASADGTIVLWDLDQH